MNEKWFLLSISQIEKKLKTNAALGLSRKAARSAWRFFSPKAGSLFIRKNKTVGKMLIEILADFALILLLILSTLAVMFEEQSIGVTVFGIVFINIFISLVFYYRAQRSVEQINEYFLPIAKVIRGGKLYRTCFENIVPGDVILLEKGDIVCADARLVTSDNLSVSMRCGKNNYIFLKKQAAGIISQDESDPKRFLNILHAGSIIEEGSARAIVYATGKYTYLGALTGGIIEKYSDNIPNELKNIKKMCSRLSMIFMLSILPFSIISLLLSHMSGGSSTLSTAFLTALSISASSMTQLSCTLCKVFFVFKIKDLARGKNAVAIRTTEAFDKLLGVKYLFMLDGSAVTDGVLHFDSAFNAEGEIKSFDNYTSSVGVLFELVSLYNTAESNALTLGTNIPDRFKIGLNEFLEKGKIDFEALKIRCPIRSYVSGTVVDPIDRVIYSDAGKKMVLGVSSSEEIFSQCSYSIVSGRVQPLSSVGVDRLKHTFNVNASKGKKVLVFTVSTQDESVNGNKSCFVGAIVLREGVDQKAISSISALKQRGVNVILFVNGDISKNSPDIPIELHQSNGVYRSDFIREKQPITYKFGDINTYYGLNDSEINDLIKCAHDMGSSVGVVAFSDEYASEAISNADLFITCAPIINVFSAKNEEELYTLELAGGQMSTSCIQSIKSEADVLIQRPNGKHGGISSLISAFSQVERAKGNLMRFFKYMLGVQLVRICMVALPMMLGTPILDGRHVLLCSFIIDMFALLMFASDKQATFPKYEKMQEVFSIKQLIIHDRSLTISSLMSGLVAIILPVIMDTLGFIGPYLYKTEYLMFTMLWLHISILFFVRYKSVINIKLALKNKIFLGIVAGIIVFVVLFMISTPLGLFFDILTNPFSYCILSFVPAILFSIAFCIISHVISKNE